jgi:hypothetical protein
MLEAKINLYMYSPVGLTIDTVTIMNKGFFLKNLR